MVLGCVVILICTPECCARGVILSPRGDDISAPGEDEAAGAHLCQIFGREPRDAAPQARVGVMEALKQNYCSAARRLSKLPEKDLSTLDFLLNLIPFNQRKQLAQVNLPERIHTSKVDCTSDSCNFLFRHH